MFTVRYVEPGTNIVNEKPLVSYDGNVITLTDGVILHEDYVINKSKLKNYLNELDRSFIYKGDKIVVSNHAYDRFVERFKSKRAVTFISRAVKNGKKIENPTHSIMNGHYNDNVFIDVSRNIVVIISENTVKTVYPLKNSVYEKYR